MYAIRSYYDLTLAMAITEPGCGSDPSQVQTTAVLDPATDEWVLDGEKIFVTTGCRAEGVVLWATIDNRITSYNVCYTKLLRRASRRVKSATAAASCASAIQ